MASQSGTFWLKLGLLLLTTLQISEASCCIHYHYYHTHKGGSGKKEGSKHKEGSQNKEGSKNKGGQKHKDETKKSHQYGEGHVQTNTQIIGHMQGHGHGNQHINPNGHYITNTGHSQHVSNIPDKQYVNSGELPGSHSPISNNGLPQPHQIPTVEAGYPPSHLNDPSSVPPSDQNLYEDQPWKPIVGYVIMDPPYRKKTQHNNEINHNNDSPHPVYPEPPYYN